MAPLRLRDRDAIITKEGLIFRVFGYAHSPKSYVCDVEYASSEIFRSSNPKAFRKGPSGIFFKFYEDEGWKFVQKELPAYMIFHEMLQRKIAGVNHRDILESRKPEEALRKLETAEDKDQLLIAIHNVLDRMAESTCLTSKDFGVFGSLLHGFYHPEFSDMDLVIYGRRNAATLREMLKDAYADAASPLRNEFQTRESISGKNWHFRNFSAAEYLWHQRRKLIYALFEDSKSGRTIKTEFEPVRDWNEIRNEYAAKTRIVQKGWTRILAKVVEDEDAFFVPSTYCIEPLEVIRGPREAVESKRIVSYLEEFRMQAEKGEVVDVEGNLEQVDTPNGSFLQVTLTYCPRYYEQAMKIKN